MKMKKSSTKGFSFKNKAFKEKRFESIYFEEYDSIYSFVASKINHKEKISELTLDIFFRFWKYLKEDHTPDNTKSYLFKIAKNVIYDYYQSTNKRKGRQVFLDTFPEMISTSPNPEQALLNEELKDMLDKSISMLSPQSAKIFRMIRIDGMKYSEVAKELNISVNTVDTQLSRAVKKLRTLLASYQEQKALLARKTIENLSVIILIDFFFKFF